LDLCTTALDIPVTLVNGNLVAGLVELVLVGGEVNDRWRRQEVARRLLRMRVEHYLDHSPLDAHNHVSKMRLRLLSERPKFTAGPVL
jgi:putative NIF3 family GTP cyclohydrolase 1 type 2